MLKADKFPITVTLTKQKNKDWKWSYRIHGVLVMQLAWHSVQIEINWKAEMVKGVC